MAVLDKSIVEDDGNFYLKVQKLETEPQISGRKRECTFEQMRVFTSESIQTALINWFKVDTNFLDVIKPFVSLSSNIDVAAVHKVIAADLSLLNLSLQMNEL